MNCQIVCTFEEASATVYLPKSQLSDTLTWSPFNRGISFRHPDSITLSQVLTGIAWQVR
jgi:hypothetical protein